MSTAHYVKKEFDIPENVQLRNGEYARGKARCGARGISFVTSDPDRVTCHRKACMSSSMRNKTDKKKITPAVRKKLEKIVAWLKYVAYASSLTKEQKNMRIEAEAALKFNITPGKYSDVMFFYKHNKKQIDAQFMVYAVDRRAAIMATRQKNQE